MTEAGAESTVLHLHRLIDAPAEKVFRAWTNPSELMRWFGPDGCSVDEVESELVVGGRYSIRMTVPGGEKVHHFGEYLELESPHRLAFTWVLSDQPCDGSAGQLADTKVVLDLAERGGKTALTLIHERLPNANAVEGHRMGWEGSLVRLVQLVRSAP